MRYLILLIALLSLGCISTNKHRMKMHKAWDRGFEGGIEVGKQLKEIEALQSINELSILNFEAEKEIRELNRSLEKCKR